MAIKSANITRLIRFPNDTQLDRELDSIISQVESTINKITGEGFTNQIIPAAAAIVLEQIGTGDHSKLINLDFNNSGHVGFAGVGANNIFIGSNTFIQSIFGNLIGTSSFSTSSSFSETSSVATTASFAETASFLLNNNDILVWLDI